MIKIVFVFNAALVFWAASIVAAVAQYFDVGIFLAIQASLCFTVAKVLEEHDVP